MITYRAMEKRIKKDVQNVIIQAVDCNQLSVLPSISTVGNLANDPLWEKSVRERKDRAKKKVKLSSQTFLQVGHSI